MSPKGLSHACIVTTDFMGRGFLLVLSPKTFLHSSQNDRSRTQISLIISFPPYPSMIPNSHSLLPPVRTFLRNKVRPIALSVCLSQLDSFTSLHILQFHYVTNTFLSHISCSLYFISSLLFVT